MQNSPAAIAESKSVDEPLNAPEEEPEDRTTSGIGSARFPDFCIVILPDDDEAPSQWRAMPHSCSAEHID